MSALIVGCSWQTKKVEITWCWQAITFETADIYPSICLLLILFHLQVALNSFIVLEEKDVIWGMIHLMRQAPRWAAFRDRRLQTVAKRKKFHEERRLNLIPKLEAQSILALKAYPSLNWELFMTEDLKFFWQKHQYT